MKMQSKAVCRMLTQNLMKKQNNTGGGLVQRTPVLGELVELGSLEAATGHREN